MFNDWRFGRHTPKPDYTISEKNVSIENLRKHLPAPDVCFRMLDINGVPLWVVYIEGLVNTALTDDVVVKPLVLHRFSTHIRTAADFGSQIEAGLLYHVLNKKRTVLAELIDDLLNGLVAVINDELAAGYTFELKGFAMRSVAESSNEAVIKGPKDAFIEVLRVNTAMVRRHIKSPDLCIEQMNAGTVSPTAIALLYMGSTVDQAILDELKKRIAEITEIGINATAALEEHIVDYPWSIFPQAVFTERPDKLCSNILEGKIGIIIDGLPTAYIVPVAFGMYMQAPEDYANNYFTASFMRVMRYICIFVAIILPGFFVAISSFNQEMIPTELAKSINKSKEGVPFPTYVEMFFFIIAFEILLESGMRLPKTIGHTIPIIGGLVVGQAAVQAKLVSPAVVVVTAIAGIAGFILPNHDMFNAMRICRIILLLGGSAFGLFGLAVTVVILLGHLTSLDSFGVPYMAPFVASGSKHIVSDTFYRGLSGNYSGGKQNE